MWKCREKEIHVTISYMYAFLSTFKNYKDFLVIDQY